MHRWSATLSDLGQYKMKNRVLSQPYRIRFDFPYWLKTPPYGCFIEILMSGDYDANQILLVLVLLLLFLPLLVLPMLLLISTTAAAIPVPIDDALAVAVAVVENICWQSRRRCSCCWSRLLLLIVKNRSINFPNGVGKPKDQIRNYSGARYLGVM